ncbi:hypothetical protein, partial [Kutzneria kofuensis]|uniref:hypothetical protein n=1 Tax=Kutzneria kofuensis TaxID=103725 RepID=UPI0031EBE471
RRKAFTVTRAGVPLLEPGIAASATCATASLSELTSVISGCWLAVPGFAVESRRRPAGTG